MRKKSLLIWYELNFAYYRFTVGSYLNWSLENCQLFVHTSSIFMCVHIGLFIRGNIVKRPRTIIRIIHSLQGNKEFASTKRSCN